jgi:hypothetical protein
MSAGSSRSRSGGPNFPTETFRVLKEHELREYGEYRTRRLVLEAWDRLGLEPRNRDGRYVVEPGSNSGSRDGNTKRGEGKGSRSVPSGLEWPQKQEVLPGMGGAVQGSFGEAASDDSG